MLRPYGIFRDHPIVNSGCNARLVARMLRLYGIFRDHPIVHQPQNPMNVIRHHHKFIQMGIGKMLGDALPNLGDDLTRDRGCHLLLLNLTEAALPLMGADCDEISPNLAVVVMFEPNRSAVV
jgi:hypothetical protein